MSKFIDDELDVNALFDNWLSQQPKAIQNNVRSMLKTEGAISYTYDAYFAGFIQGLQACSKIALS
jgi:hypothetical protein